jgi:hypothetical protein
VLTVWSQTVRILLDAVAHVRGNHAGQAHNGGHVCTSWDRLAGFKSRHPDQVYQGKTARLAAVLHTKRKPDRAKHLFDERDCAVLRSAGKRTKGEDQHG